MNWGKIFSITILVLSVAASLGYLWAKDYRRAAYWACAAGITASVTF